jgi:phage recombination protein Bet
MSNEIVKAGGALAIRPDQTTWTEQQAAVLRQSGISDDVTAAELAGFLHLCQRTELDPFSRQIYLIGRKDKRAGRVVFTPQTGIDGYRVVARRATVKSGGTYGYEDTLWCDKDGRWRDVWLPDAPPAAAKVTVLRDGQKYSAVALFREYVQTGWENKPIGLWGKMPAGQLAKCAEALALRKAFPHDLAGVYTAEEMAQADNAGDERHLRAVQPGEQDPWASPAPEQNEQPQPAAQSRDYLADAQAAASAEAVREIYRAAAADGYGPGSATLKAIAAIGKDKAAAERPDTDEVVVGEVVDEAAAAEKQLRATAAAAGLTNLDEEFEKSYGLPISEAGVAQLTEMTQILGGAAA